MVSRTVRKLIMEGISNVTYHFCRLNSCYYILKNDCLKLTMSTNFSDAKDNKRFFYFSTQRSRSTQEGYANGSHCDVRIQLDGTRLGQLYKGGPLDYWGANMGKQAYYTNPGNAYGQGFTNAKRHHPEYELEDRIYSYKPEIKNAHNYITRIDVLIDDTRQDLIEQEMMWAYAIYSIGKYQYSKYFQVNVYDDRAQFDSMGPKTINDKMEAIMNNYGSDEYKKYQGDYSSEASEHNRMRRKFATMLVSMINIAHGGYLRYDKDKDRFIINYLRKTGFMDYKDFVFGIVNGSFFDESLETSARTLKDGLRKLNSEYPESQEANRLMQLGAQILKREGITNFDELTRRYYNGYIPNKEPLNESIILEDLLRASNIITLSPYRQGNMSAVCHNMKERGASATYPELRQLAIKIQKHYGNTSGLVIVPIPSRSGYSEDGAKFISDMLGARYCPCIGRNPGQSLYMMKKSGREVSEEDTGFYLKSAVPNGNILLFDNVIATGTSLSSAMRLLGRPCDIACLAVDYNEYH